MPNKYAYRVYRTLTTPIYGGTVTANSMDQAVEKVLESCKIEAVTVTDEYNGMESSYFMLKGEKVGILVYANPENFA